MMVFFSDDVFVCSSISAFLILYPLLVSFFLFPRSGSGFLPFSYLLVFMMVFILSRSGSILSIRHIYIRARTIRSLVVYMQTNHHYLFFGHQFNFCFFSFLFSSRRSTTVQVYFCTFGLLLLSLWQPLYSPSFRFRSLSSL